MPSDDKKAARLNCTEHLLSQVDYADAVPPVVSRPEMREISYVRPPMHEQTFVPQLYVHGHSASRASAGRGAALALGDCSVTVGAGCHDPDMPVTADELRRHFLAAWGPDTCYPHMREEWSPENPSRDQCGPYAGVHD